MARKPAALKRRTTLTLPSDPLLQAKKIAHSSSTVISEVMSAPLQLESARHRRNQILDHYRKAFMGFSEDELAFLNGVILEPVRGRRR